MNPPQKKAVNKTPKVAKTTPCAAMGLMSFK